MAEKRMFAQQIIDSDAFLDMPLSTQALYFHLSMRADDEGFINNPKKIQRTIGASDDDFKLLIAKNFIIPFESGVVVIKHWKIHNYIRADRIHETKYTEEKSLLQVKENGAYTLSSDLCQSSDGQVAGKCQVRLDKNRLEEIRLDKNNKLSSLRSDNSSVTTDYETVKNLWNELDGLGNIKGIKSISPGSKRLDNVRARLKTFGMDGFTEAIENIKKSSFLQGNNTKGWTITFDWFVLPSNFPKVLEGNYNDKTGKEDWLDL